MLSTKGAEPVACCTDDGLLFPSTQRRNTIAVLGLGNILLSDEGVGVHAVEVLKSRYSFFPTVDIIDGGTMGLDLLPLFQDRDRILVIDAVDFRRGPGHIALVEGNQIPPVLNSKLSVHHIGLIDLILASRLTRETPLQLCLAGIEPLSLEVGLSLTGMLQTKLDALIRQVLNKLRTWGVSVTPD